MIVSLGFAADRQRNVAHLVPAVVILVVRIEHVERIARQHFALEVDVVGVDADQFLDDRGGDIIAQRGFVDALIQPYAAAIVFAAFVPARLGKVGIDVADVDRDVCCVVG